MEPCRQIDVLTAGAVAIDGSELKAVNHRGGNLTTAKVKLRINHLEDSAARYLEEMARTDRQEQAEATLRKVDRLKEKLARVREEVRRLQAIARRLKETPDSQISLTDPDARSMAAYGKGTALAGYFVQTAVDAETHLIVTLEVTNTGNDRAQLAPMAKAAKVAMRVSNLLCMTDPVHGSRKEA